MAIPSKKQYNFFMADNEEIKKQIDFLFKKILKIEKFLQNLNFRPYSVEDVKLDNGERDELFDDAVKVVASHNRASSSLLQRRLVIGFNRAARLIEQLEEDGVVGPGDGATPREVLIKIQPMSSKKENNPSFWQNRAKSCIIFRPF